MTSPQRMTKVLSRSRPRTFSLGSMMTTAFRLLRRIWRGAMPETTTMSSAAETVLSDGPGDGSVYGAFVSRQLDDERSRKESLEARAAGVITSSGVLVTLLFGLAAITTNTKNFR